MITFEWVEEYIAGLTDRGFIGIDLDPLRSTVSVTRVVDGDPMPRTVRRAFGLRCAADAFARVLSTARAARLIQNHVKAWRAARASGNVVSTKSIVRMMREKESRDSDVDTVRPVIAIERATARRKTTFSIRKNSVHNVILHRSLHDGKPLTPFRLAVASTAPIEQEQEPPRAASIVSPCGQTGWGEDTSMKLRAQALFEAHKAMVQMGDRYNGDGRYWDSGGLRCKKKDAATATPQSLSPYDQRNRVEAMLALARQAEQELREQRRLQDEVEDAAAEQNAARIAAPPARWEEARNSETKRELMAWDVNRGYRFGRFAYAPPHVLENKLSRSVRNTYEGTYYTFLLRMTHLVSPCCLYLNLNR